MMIGITGTDGAGKGENSLADCSQGLASCFGACEQKGDKVYCACKAPVPNEFYTNY